MSAIRPCTSWPAKRNFLPNTFMMISTIGTVINVTSVNFQSMSNMETKEPIKVTDSVIRDIRLSTTAD